MDHTIPQEHSMSQEVKTCEICAAAQLQIFCNNCQISLCGKCDTEHRKGRLCSLHDKVLFPDLNKLLFPRCTIHQDQTCHSYCKQCDIPVCNKCKTQTHHDHHELIEMSHFVSTKLNEIKAEIEELLKKVIPWCRQTKADTASKLSMTEVKYDQMIHELEIHRKIWHQEVDGIFNSVMMKIRSEKEKSLRELQNHQSDLAQIYNVMYQTVQEDRDILMSKEAAIIAAHKSRLMDCSQFKTGPDIKIPILRTKTNKGRELSLQLENIEASLTQNSCVSNMMESISNETLPKDCICTSITNSTSNENVPSIPLCALSAPNGRPVAKSYSKVADSIAKATEKFLLIKQGDKSSLQRKIKEESTFTCPSSLGPSQVMSRTLDLHPTENMACSAVKTMEVSVIENTTRDRSKSLDHSKLNPVEELTKTILVAHRTKAEQKSLTERFSAIPLTNGQLLKKARVISSFSTGLENLTAVACYGNREAWICGETKVIKRLDIQGFQKNALLATCKYFPGDIAVTRNGELIYSNVNARTVTVVREEKTEILVQVTKGWHPCKLCCTSSGDILVAMFTSDDKNHKIVRYHEGKIIQEIEKVVNYENPLFQEGRHPVYITENTNGDICAADLNAEMVVVVDNRGKEKFRYNGTAAKRAKPFVPGPIMTDSSGHIIVSDQINDCLHILDKNGQFLGCIGDCGLDQPTGLSVDKEGRLWVGSYNTGNVKVIEYLKPRKSGPSQEQSLKFLHFNDKN
ncbi:tripartite motif-containing protein 2-like [Magallana gigas]|uniref:tripartite motif-containing protein 2-like n=1 Tax=Magallana gigas TaxID=29159 RepID=UPI00334220CA